MSIKHYAFPLRTQLKKKPLARASVTQHGKKSLHSVHTLGRSLSGSWYNPKLRIDVTM